MGWTLFGLVWGLWYRHPVEAVTSRSSEYRFWLRGDGVLVLIAIKPVMSSPAVGHGLAVAGGCLHGGLVLRVERVPYTHAIWTYLSG